MVMAKKIFAALSALALASVAGAANAQEASRWFVHVGPAYVEPAESAKMTAGGSPVPGADVSIDGRWTVAGELGYFVTRNISVSLAAGAPPTFKVMASGTLAGLGEAGQMTGGPAGVLAQYHFKPDGRLDPYVGAGVAFLVVFDTSDGSLSNLKANSAVGPAIQAGADYKLNDKYGVFVDVKKAWVGTVAKANLGPIPVRAKVKIDPIVFNAGLTYRF
jgi:outer membrane protein